MMINKETIKDKLNSVKKYLKNVYRTLKKPEMMILPGQISFFIILSIVPIITLIGYISQYFGFSNEVFIDLISKNFGSSIASNLVPIVNGNSFDLNLLILFITLFIVASKGAHSIIIASNEICNIKNNRIIKSRIKALVLTVLIVFLMIFVLLVPAFGKLILKAFSFFNIKHVLLKVYQILQGPVSYLIIFVFIKIIYHFAPNAKIKSKNVNKGSLFTTVGWILSTLIYSYYVSGRANYELFYAGLSNIAVLMIWIYFLSYIFVIGMSLSYENVKENNVDMINSI